jgi:uncharacterized protein YbjT (DUF2867 family)
VIETDFIKSVFFHLWVNINLRFKTIMATVDSKILAIGANGRFASLVVPELVKRGAKVRGFIREAEDSDSVRQNGASEVAVGDLRDRDSLDAALNGVTGVFYIAPAFQPDEVQLGFGVIEAAQQAGVRRIVFSSVIHPILSAMVNHAAKAPVEEALLASNLEYTLLHPALFYQNFAADWESIVETGVYAEPYSKETSMSRVDYRDVAEVAAIALTEDRLLFGTFELCAEERFNREEVGAIMSAVLGRTIEVAEPNFEDWAVKAGLADKKDLLPPLKKMYDHYNKTGLLGSGLTLKAILGREPRSLRKYFEELAAKSKQQR